MIPGSDHDPPIAGRSAEFREIGRFLDRAFTAGDSLLVWGEVGIGKSVMLEEAARDASCAGAAVIRAAGSEFETDVAYSGVQQLVMPLRRYVPHLAPPLRENLLAALGCTGSAPAVRAHVAEAVAALLRAATGSRPLVWVADDVQWFDRSSAAVLNALAARTDLAQFGLLCAVRQTRLDDYPMPDMPALRLGPLDEATSADLLSERYPALPGDLRRRARQQAAGNPLALLALPAVLESWSLRGGSGMPGTGPIADKLTVVFEDSLATLPAPTLHILLLAALDGQADLAVLARAAPEVPVPDVLRPAQDAGLASVDDRSRRIVFRHPLVGAAVVYGAPPGERRAAHRALGEALAGQADRLVHRAWHLAQASLTPDEAVARLLEAAAGALARRGDVGGAVTMMIRAADLSPGQAMRVSRLASAAYHSAHGDLGQASRLAESLPGDSDPPAATLSAAVAGTLVLLYRDGDIDTAHRLIGTAISNYPDRADARDTMLINAMQAFRSVCRYGERRELWPAYHEAIGRLRPGPPADLALSTVSASGQAQTPGPMLDALGDAIRSLEGEADPVRLTWVANAAYAFDRIGECRDALLQMIAAQRRDGVHSFVIQGLLLLGLDEVKRGLWYEALEHAQEAFGLAAEHGFSLFTQTARFQLGLVAAARGETDVVSRQTADMLRWAIPRGSHTMRSLVARVRIVEASGRGDFEAAYHQATSIGPAGELAPHSPMALAVPLYLVDAAVRTGRVDEAAAHARVLEQADIARLSPRLAMIQHACSAAVAAGSVARRGFEQALAVPGAGTWAFDHAQVLLMFGSHLRRHRSVAASRGPLSQAVAAFDRLGARPWAARARGELAATARRRVSRADRCLGELTPQEHEIAALAASGLSNRKIAECLFISPRTVSNHLYRAFPKLGVTSRAELRDALSAASEVGGS